MVTHSARLLSGGLVVIGMLFTPLVPGETQGVGHHPTEAMNRVAPGFSLRDLDGDPLSLAKYQGKVVLLDFWATWCAPCQVEIPHLVELQYKYQGRGLQIIGLSMDDDPGPVRAFYRQHKMNYPVAMANLKVARSYGGILGLPVRFVIGRDGRIKIKHAGAMSLSDLEAEIRAQL